MFFFFNDTATTEIYTLSLHDALPIFHRVRIRERAVEVNDVQHPRARRLEPARDLRRIAVVHLLLRAPPLRQTHAPDRKSTRLNSSHANISYAVFCLKKKKKYKE